jgi:G3E family GTPase
MKTIRFLMVGGFLGAGKTTAIARLAASYTSAGKTVALVTNDQAYDLVDTHTLRSQGYEVGEVPGACFCCNFDDLIETISGLSESSVPDIVIAEPVGSCTDLVATVIEPMKDLFGDRFELGPLVVLLKPEHGKKILGAAGRRGFSPKAEYIFLKQLEEADAIVINKVDKLTPAEQSELMKRVNEKFPEIPAVYASGRDGTNMEQVIELFEQPPRRRSTMMDVDYDTYAVGEAELGWFNCKIDAKAAEKFSLDDLALNLVENIGSKIGGLGCEVAHLKVIAQTMQSNAVANLVSSGGNAELSLASEVSVTEAELVVNARVAASPEQLEATVEDVAQSLGRILGVALVLSNVQCFRPAKPTPTHRAS